LGTRHSIEEMRDLARQRGGDCLSERFVTLQGKLCWQCSKGHMWSAIAGNVLRGSWCPICAHRVRGTLRDMQQIAASRGGSCLSEVYVRQSDLMQWRCAQGHVWTATGGAIKRGRWCGVCASVAKRTIEQMHELTIARGSCLSSVYVGVDSPLTWRCDEGHTWQATPASVLRGSWCAICVRNRRLELAEMRRVAESRHGKCLSPTYRNNHTPLVWQCERGHRWKAAPQNVCRDSWHTGTWCPVCASQRRKFQERLTLDEVQSIALAHGGLCLSEEYVGSMSKLLWQCAEGHTWEALVTPVRRGSWCPVCARNQKLNLEYFQKIAKSRGGKCLSSEYLNKDAPLLFECEVGHQWRARGGHVKQGSWCRQCVSLARRSKYKASCPVT
jgi:hypothetical protein